VVARKHNADVEGDRVNSTERENYEYLKARVVNLESDLQAARAELEAARGRAEGMERAGVEQAKRADQNAIELATLRRLIDEAGEITAEYFGDFVCWIPAFDEPTEQRLNMQPGETRTFRLLEVKP
jgi:hypothetical protein